MDKKPTTTEEEGAGSSCRSSENRGVVGDYLSDQGNYQNEQKCSGRARKYKGQMLVFGPGKKEEILPSLCALF